MNFKTLPEEELIQRIIHNKQQNRYTYARLAVKFGIPEERIRELYKPYLKNLKEKSFTTDLIIIKDRIRRFKLSCTPYWQMSEQLNMSEEEIKKLGKEFPWAKPSIPKYIKGGSEGTSPTDKPKTLSVGVLSRFMKDEELEKFLQNYKSNLKSGGGTDRKTIFAQPIPKEDIELLKIYVTDFETSLEEIAKTHGISKGVLYTKVLRISVKVIAQHPEVLDL